MKPRTIFHVGMIILLSLLLLWGPLLIALSRLHPFLATERWNDQWAPIASSFPLYPGNSLEISFEASEDDLSAVAIYLEPTPFFSWGDAVTVTLYQQGGSTPIFTTTVTTRALWKNFGFFEFPALENTRNSAFTLRLSADINNRKALLLAQDYKDQEQFIVQPFYDNHDSLLEGSAEVAGRLTWRLVPLLMLTGVLPFFLWSFFAVRSASPDPLHSPSS